MSDIWMGIAPNRLTTRVIAMAGASETILKARLSPRPHPRALPSLLEAIAMWQGVRVRAALCVDDRDGACDSRLFHDAFDDVGEPLYTLEWVAALGGLGRRRRRDIAGLGDFADLRDLVLGAVPR